MHHDAPKFPVVFEHLVQRRGDGVEVLGTQPALGLQEQNAEPGNSV
jgi:hypothetical protein